MASKSKTSKRALLPKRKGPRYVYYFGDGHADGTGMMDTILNLGMNDEVVDIIAEKTNNPRFAYDSYRRFLQMYGDVVMGVQKRPDEDHEPFERAIEYLKDERYGKHDFPDVKLTD